MAKKTSKKKSKPTMLMEVIAKTVARWRKKKISAQRAMSKVGRAPHPSEAKVPQLVLGSVDFAELVEGFGLKKGRAQRPWMNQPGDFDQLSTADCKLDIYLKLTWLLLTS